MSALTKFLLVALAGFIVTYLCTPLVRKLAIKFGMVDMPNERRPHKRPTPRAGGVAVFLGVHAACLLALILPAHEAGVILTVSWYLYYALASLLIFAIGLVDDYRGLPPLVKLAGQIGAAAIACMSGTRFGSLLGLELPPILDACLVVFWLVAIMNAFNLIDGLDGLASGLAAIAGLGLCGVFAVTVVPGNVIVLAGLVGASLAFLRYNFHPASIFLGDTGSLFLGFTLGLVALTTNTKSTFLVSFTIPVLVLGVPIYDELLAIWRRSVRLWLTRQTIGRDQKAKGIMQADVDHLHHRLLRSGLGTRTVAILLCAGNAALVVLGLLLISFRSQASAIYLFIFLIGAFVVMRHLAVIELRDTGHAILNGLRRPSPATVKLMLYPSWDMFWMCAAALFAFAVTGPRPEDFWRAWFLDLPIWVTPTFSLLALSRTYLTVWSRARMLDVLMLAFTLAAGLLLSVVIALLLQPQDPVRCIVQAVLIAAISHGAIIGARVFYRSLEEVVVYLRNKSERDSDGNRILLYGAGGRCQLFLKERSFNNSSSYDDRVIVGLIDDNESLHDEWVYGYQVLGSSKDLPELVKKYQIASIIITAALPDAARKALVEQASRHGLKVSEWYFVDEPQSETARRSVEMQLQATGPQKTAGTQETEFRSQASKTNT